MHEYKPNSHRFKEEQKAAAEAERKVEKVVSGKVRTKKKNEMTKLADVFISEDVHNVKSYILMDVLVPTIKKAIVDIVTDGVNMIFMGGTSRSRTSSGSKVSYRNYYDRREDDYRDRGRSRFDFDDILFDNRGEAEAVLDQMADMIDRYGRVTVADMYDMADLSHPFTANNYGWEAIGSARVVPTRDGYVIKLPKAVPMPR